MSTSIAVPDDFPTVFTGSPAERRLRTLGDVTIYTERGADRQSELVRRIADADVVLSLRNHSRYTEQVLAASPRLRLISLWGTGVDNVDLEVCRARGIRVTNTPGVNAHAVAEHAIGLILTLARRIPAMDATVRAGGWRGPHDRLVQLEGRTLGIVGLGAIGRRMAELGRAFGMRLLVFTWDADQGRATSVGAEPASIEQLLRESDVVSLHLRLTADSRNFLDRDRLALMKPTAFLINTARGALVDHDALVDILRAERIGGAGLDVFHEEPIPAGDPILELPNVLLTPHNAGTTPEVIEAGLERAVENIERFLRA